jgi:ATP-binding cassette subfamily B protein/subfamily B ATP-binding cassette protein MsbA
MSNAVAIRFSQGTTYEVGADLFLHLQKLSLLFHSRRSVGDLMSRVTGDAGCVQNLVNSALIPLVESTVTLVTMFFIMWKMEPTLTLLSLSLAPLLVLSIRLFGKPMKARGKQRREIEVRIPSLVQQSLSAIPAVQAFSREELEHSRFRRFADDTIAAYISSSYAHMLFKLTVGLITTLGTAMIMYFGAVAVLQGRITVGTVLVFLAYLKSLYGPLNSMTYVASTLQTLTVSSDRVLEILDTPLDVQDAPHATDLKISGAVEFDNVSFGYDPDRPVLRGVSFAAVPGETVAVVGPTGAGKTTLMSLLVRFFDPWSGRIMIDGHDLRSIRLRSLRQQASIVLQEPFIFPTSVAENIAYGRPDATREEIEAAALAANADEFIRKLPLGYDTIVGERGSTLSGGQKQRLSTARAFLMDPPILILDEPTSALDARSEALLLEAVGRLMKGRTTFIIAHRLSTIRDVDRILMINDGRIAESGTHEELMELDQLYAGFYRIQFRRDSSIGSEAQNV